MIKINKKNKQGYAILELLFYISFFAVISLVVINAMITMARSFKQTSIQAELIQSGNIIERMSREIRQAYDIDMTSTSTNLKLNTKDGGGIDKIIEFKFISPDIQFWDAGINIGNLNIPNITVSDVAFTQIITAKGKAVEIVLTVKSNNDATGNTQNFYDTIILRGAY